METLKRHLPFSGQEGLQELKKIAIRFEEKIYSAAVSQQDYLRKISLKMLTMENKSQNPLQSNSPSNSNKPPDPGSHNMQSQLHNQGQSLPTQLPSSQQVRQQLLSQNIQNNIASAGVQGSAGLALPSVPSLSQAPIPNIANGWKATGGWATATATTSTAVPELTAVSLSAAVAYEAEIPAGKSSTSTHATTYPATAEHITTNTVAIFSAIWYANIIHDAAFLDAIGSSL
ncbi:CTV.22 [Tripterygium wilfordii]|uniref:CTV.22 n=1 Tax=Tripterygium wilfordii TaxID=458696 RepID=A0A7J7BYI7_TRIWF|nr:CTV.22 [Tripterygium wilfordii]